MDQQQWQDIRREFHFVREQLQTLAHHSAVHNTLLKEHEARSLALKEMLDKEKAERTALSLRLAPVESHVSTAEKILKWGGAVLAGLIIQFIVRLVFK